MLVNSMSILSSPIPYTIVTDIGYFLRLCVSLDDLFTYLSRSLKLKEAFITWNAWKDLE